MPQAGTYQSYSRREHGDKCDAYEYHLIFTWAPEIDDDSLPLLLSEATKRGAINGETYWRSTMPMKGRRYTGVRLDGKQDPRMGERVPPWFRRVGAVAGRECVSFFGQCDLLDSYTGICYYSVRRVGWMWGQRMVGSKNIRSRRRVLPVMSAT